MQLNEGGLRPDVLKDLIYDIISIDEYTPKIDVDNIVVYFQVLDNFDAAYDLSSFLERAPVKIVDTEAAEIPNVDGRYEVFVEFARDAEFPEQFETTLELIKNLSPNNDWKLQMYGINDPVDLKKAKLKKSIRLNSKKVIDEFFNESFSKISITENTIQVNGEVCTKFYSKSSGLVSEEYVKPLLKNCTYDNSGLSEMLGSNYTVVLSEGKYICSNGSKYFILE